MISLTYIFAIYIMYCICDELFTENNDEEKETSISSKKEDNDDFKVKLMNASKNKFANSTIMKNRKKKKEM